MKNSRFRLLIHDHALLIGFLGVVSIAAAYYALVRYDVVPDVIQWMIDK